MKVGRAALVPSGLSALARPAYKAASPSHTLHIQHTPTNNRFLENETEGCREVVVAVHWMKELIPLDLWLIL